MRFTKIWKQDRNWSKTVEQTKIWKEKEKKLKQNIDRIKQNSNKQWNETNTKVVRLIKPNNSYYRKQENCISKFPHEINRWRIRGNNI